jgi:hypothetical protein
MIALSLGSIPFCAVLYRTQLVPRALAVLGIVGYASLLLGSVLTLLGLDLHMIHFILGGLFELLLPLWLIAKGFNDSADIVEPVALVGYEPEGVRVP